MVVIIIIIIIVPLIWLPYKRIIHVYVYKYNEQPVSQDSNNTRFSHAGQQQHKV